LLYYSTNLFLYYGWYIQKPKGKKLFLIKDTHTDEVVISLKCSQLSLSKPIHFGRWENKNKKENESAAEKFSFLYVYDFPSNQR
jgi:hypothetical protein